MPAFARGLRNSMALVATPDAKLIAATNARDFVNVENSGLSDELLPHDTLTWLAAGADYGWPYCFDKNRPNPEYVQFDCLLMVGCASDFPWPSDWPPLQAAESAVACPDLSGLYWNNGGPGNRYADKSGRTLSVRLLHYTPSAFVSA
ncbi:hypothetical protein CS8_041900 [Cupriavidus sp. 8B]